MRRRACIQQSETGDGILAGETEASAAFCAHAARVAQFADKGIQRFVDSAAIEWNIDTAKGVAVARLPDGKGEVILDRWQGPDSTKESVLHNVKYFGAQSNTGFRMWKNKRHAYNHHGKKFEYSGTNGFLITINFSGQAKKAASD